MARLRFLLRELVVGLPRRALLTLRYRGLRSFVWRLVTFPLRPTGLGHRLGIPPVGSDRLARQRSAARRWYRRWGRRATVVIPSYGAPELALAAARSVRETTDRSRVRVLIVDDGSPAEDQERLRRAAPEAELILLERNRGFTATVNRGLDELADDEDAVVLNSDVVANPRWLETLQFAAWRDPDVGIVAPRLLYPDGTVQSAGSHRNLAAPEWFDHRYRFQPAHHDPAQVPVDLLAATGACMYLRSDLLAEGIRFAEDYELGFEDVDLCLRSWESGRRVVYAPAATLVHAESKTRGGGRSERELRSLETFWRRWGDWFDAREVGSPDGGLRIVYVTEGTGVGGGHRVVFEHMNGLLERGHDVELWTLDPPPDWFPLSARVRTFEDFPGLERELAGEDAIKVATWWTTAAWVWRASVRRGIPVYLVQDIETSYYKHDPWRRAQVMASYRQEFRYLATSGWVCERLRELGLKPAQVPPGVGLDTFRPLDLSREQEVVLAVGRTHPLKDFPLTLAGWERLREPRPRLRLFGIEPQVVGRHSGVEYVEGPSDEEVNRLYNAATLFVQTSRHEGFCLPLLEAMAAGTPVVCTDADGNRDFCRDGENCLLVERTPEAVSAAIARLLGDPALRERLGRAGQETALAYAWPERIAELERFFTRVAAPRAAASP